MKRQKLIEEVFGEPLDLSSLNENNPLLSDKQNDELNKTSIKQKTVGKTNLADLLKKKGLKISKDSQMIKENSDLDKLEHEIKNLIEQLRTIRPEQAYRWERQFEMLRDDLKAHIEKLKKWDQNQK